MQNHFYLLKLPCIEEISMDLYPILISTRNRENILAEKQWFERKRTWN